MFAHLRILRLFNRPEPELDRQPYCLEHLRGMGRAVPKRLLSNDTYGALLVIAASRVFGVDAYQRPYGGEWNIWCQGADKEQECRFSPEQWQASYDVRLAELYPNGQLASTVDNVVLATRRVHAASRLFGKAGVA
jgi:hypothetical protein